jgi:hypothetical protein
MKRFEVYEMTDPSLTPPRPWPSAGPIGATAGRPYTGRSMALAVRGAHRGDRRSPLPDDGPTHQSPPTVTAPATLTATHTCTAPRGSAPQ